MSTERRRPRVWGMEGARIGRIAGIDILVHWSWFLILTLLTWSLAEGLYLHDYPGWSKAEAWLAGAATSLVLFACVLAHELSHSIVARRQGIPVFSITLFIFGGVSALTQEPRSPREEFVIAAVGPATSFLLAAIFALASLVVPGGAGKGLSYLAFINTLLGAFNLLPGFPLDGGRVFRAITWSRVGNLLAATRISAKVGAAVAYGLMFVGVLIFALGGFFAGIWITVIAWFLLSQTRASYRQTVVIAALEGVPIGSAITRDYVAVGPEMSITSFVSEYVLTHHKRCYPVIVDGSLRGIVSLADLKKFPREQWHERSVSEIMTPRDRLIVVAPTDDLETAAQRMAEGELEQLPVIDSEKFIGCVTRADVVRLIHARSELAALDGAAKGRRGREAHTGESR